MSTTYSKRAIPGAGTSGASGRLRVQKMGLIAAVAAVAFSGALSAAPTVKQPALDSADQLQHQVAVKKKAQASALKPRCPPKFTARCNKYQRVVCVQNDSRGCCTKSICQ
jgi:hypothetical protein